MINKQLVLFTFITTLLLTGLAGATPQITLNAPDTSNSYQFNVSNPTINISVVNASDSNNANISTVIIWLTNNSNTISGSSTLASANVTVSNSSVNYHNYTYSSNLTDLSPISYTLNVWANDSSGGYVNTTTANFSITASDVTQLESQITANTVNFRNAADTADATGDLLNTTNYTLRITVGSNTVTVGNLTNMVYAQASTVNGSAGVSSSNDPEDVEVQDRVFATVNSFVATDNYMYAKISWPAYYDVVYRLTGTAANPTFTEVTSVCNNPSNIESGATAATTNGCYWRDPSGNETRLYMASFSGGAVATTTSGFNLGGGGGGGDATTSTTTTLQTTTGTDGAGGQGFSDSPWFTPILVVLALVIAIWIMREK